MFKGIITAGLTVLVLAGCTVQSDLVGYGGEEKPEGAAPGTCWAKQIKPAVVKTTRTQSILSGENGENIYQTETSQSILEERQEVWFEVPFRRVMSEEFIKALQRALKARGQYQGPITGIIDDRTAKGVRLFQAPIGIDSQILSMAAAQQLGLIAFRFE